MCWLKKSAGSGLFGSVTVVNMTEEKVRGQAEGGVGGLEVTTSAKTQNQMIVAHPIFFFFWPKTSYDGGMETVQSVT